MLTPEDPRWTRVCEIAHAHGARAKTIAKWRDRRAIPAAWQVVLLADARVADIPVTAVDFVRPPRSAVRGALCGSPRAEGAG